MVRKELHLDEKIIQTLEKEAKRQNRSLKNYLEYLAIQQAQQLDLPSKEYMDMMDDMLERYENKLIEFNSIEKVLQKNGMPNKGL